MSFTPTPHPVLGLPTPAQAVSMGERAWLEAMARRERIIAEERGNPFLHLWEPPIWSVVDAIMGFPWVDQLKGQGWSERMRKHLGFDQPAPVVLVLGGNRGGKSEWAAHRTMRLLRLQRAEGRTWTPRAWALHSTLPMSIQYQQALLYKFLPAELQKKPIREETTYVAYKQKTGFAEQSFVLPPDKPGMTGADCLFKTYDQEMGTIEGGEIDIAWPDELVPSDWVETMELRIATRNGWMAITFTPVQGYTETVRLFLDGAETVKESIAFLCPKDGGPPDAGRALGFGQTSFGINPEEVLRELWDAENAKDPVTGKRRARASYYPQSIPENCDAWLEGKTGQPEIPAGREFERVPRVMKCAGEEGKRAVVFFHSSDNPFGNPKNVWALIANKSQEFIKERFYGLAHKTLSARFSKFDRSVHVIRPDQVPKEGTNYHFVDPCGGRNFFMGWFRVTPSQVYLYREWPSGYYIPGIGAPGPWALPDGRHPDGKRGPAQKSFGWGLRRYKEEIARLEGWKDWEERGASERGERLANGLDTAAVRSSKAEVDGWDPENGSREDIRERFLDSRYASSPKIEKDRPVTLLTELEDIGLFFSPTPGDDIDEGVSLVTDALDYDEGQEMGFLNQPRLLISADCVNTIYALTTWTGMTKEGKRNLDGATKDPIDLLRYFMLSQCAYLGGVTEEEEGEEEWSDEWEERRKEYY